MILIDVCELIVDCPHSTANDEGAGYPLIRTPNVGKGRLILDGVHRVSKQVYDVRNARAVPKAGDLILAREAPAGNVAIILDGQEVCLGQRTVLIRPDKSKVNPQYLTYYLLAPYAQHELTSAANGATVAHVNMPKIRGLKINLPDIQEQNRIAGILSAYDDLIATNQKQITLLEETAQRIYKEWFVDFRFPGNESIPIEKGLPYGWERSSLGEIAVDAGINVKVQDRDNYCYYLPIDCMPKKSLGYVEVNDISLAESSLQSFAPGDIVMGAMRPYFHKVVIARDYGLTRNTCFVINAKDSVYHDFLTMLIFDESTIRYATQNSVGTTMPYIRWKDFIQMPVVVPERGIAEKFSSIMSPLFDSIHVRSKDIQKAREARDILLGKLLS